MRINERVLIPEGIDDYLLAFMGAVDYTENCYSCQFACSERISDITLGDSWGTNLIEEEKDGVSLLLIQSSKGNELIKKADLELYDVDLQKAIEANHQLQHPSRKTHGRDIFMKYILQGATFSKATFKVYRKKILKRYIKNVIHKIKSI